MKKIIVLAAVLITVILFTYCSATKKAAVLPSAKITYQANIVPLLQANCVPCHFPEKNGRKKPLDNYADVSKLYDDAMRRVQLNPTEKGFMPDRKPAKISDSTFNVLKQWKVDGMLEK